MKLIIILSSIFSVCFYLVAETLVDDGKPLNIFGGVFVMPDGYHQTRQAGNSKLIYSLVNPNIEIDGDHTVGYITYSLLGACEFCDFHEPHEDFNIVSTCEADDYVVAEMVTTRFHQVRIFIIRNRENVLIIGEDKVLFKAWLSELGVDGCYN